MCWIWLTKVTCSSNKRSLASILEAGLAKQLWKLGVLIILCVLLLSEAWAKSRDSCRMNVVISCWLVDRGRTWTLLMTASLPFLPEETTRMLFLVLKKDWKIYGNVVRCLLMFTEYLPLEILSRSFYVCVCVFRYPLISTTGGHCILWPYDDLEGVPQRIC